MGSFMIEFWSFLRVRKKFWLTPVMIPIVAVGPLLRATQGVHHRAIQQQDSQKGERMLDAQRKIVIAGAVIAEARDDPAFKAHIKAIVRKRVTQPSDARVVAEWLSTT